MLGILRFTGLPIVAAPSAALTSNSGTQMVPITLSGRTEPLSGVDMIDKIVGEWMLLVFLGVVHSLYWMMGIK